MKKQQVGKPAKQKHGKDKPENNEVVTYKRWWVAGNR